MDLVPILPSFISLPKDKPWLYCGENHSAGTRLTDYHNVLSTDLDDFVLGSVSIINPDGRNQDIGFNFFFCLQPAKFEKDYIE